MTDVAVQAGVAVAVPPTALTPSQAAQMLADRRAEAPAGETNKVSDAARMLGQRAAEARKERQAQAAQTQESPNGEGGNVEDDPTQANSAGETLNTTETPEPPNGTDAEGQEEPADTQMIDLGDGIKVTLDEVKDGFMLKADHTRKTQALAERAKALDARESQKLAQLDKIVGVLETKIGKPKSLGELIKEYGRDEALERFAEQEEEQARLKTAQNIRDNHKRQSMAAKEKARDEYLAEHYNTEWADETKRDAAYTELTAYALKIGAREEEIPELVNPWMIEVLDKARKFDAQEANKGNITKHVADKPRVTKPGAKVSAQAHAHSAVQAAHAKAKQSGQLADAVALLRARRQAGGRST